MTTDERYMDLYKLGLQKQNDENQMWAARTSGFLTSSAFLFGGTVVLIVNGVVLGVIGTICAAGVFLCFLQNRNAYAARRGLQRWGLLADHAREELTASYREVLQRVHTQHRVMADPFKPIWIYEYWLPSTLLVIWAAAFWAAILAK